MSSRRKGKLIHVLDFVVFQGVSDADHCAHLLNVCSHSHIVHTVHECEVQACPLQCQLCKRTCIAEDHLHGLDAYAAHLCGLVFLNPMHHAWFICLLASNICVQHSAKRMEYVKSRQHPIRWMQHSQANMEPFSTRRYELVLGG
jgi:hypothetical protein